MGDREIQEYSMGPLTLNVEAARQQGWSPEDVAVAVKAMYLIARGTSMGVKFRENPDLEMHATEPWCVERDTEGGR